jgi:hypothetical protein
LREEVREMLQRLSAWLREDPIHAALTIGFACAFAAYTLDVLGKAMELSAPGYALFAICLLGVAAVAQSRRCARLVVWLSTNQTDRPR